MGGLEGSKKGGNYDEIRISIIDYKTNDCLLTIIDAKSYH